MISATPRVLMLMPTEINSWSLHMFQANPGTPHYPIFLYKRFLRRHIQGSRGCACPKLNTAYSFIFEKGYMKRRKYIIGWLSHGLVFK